MLKTKIRQLAIIQNLEIVKDIDIVTSQLQKPLEQYMELEFRSNGKRIDLITLTDNLKIAGAFVEIFEQRGLTEEELHHLKALIRFGAGKIVGVKLPIAGPTRGGEVYLRGALPLAEVSHFLQRYGVKSEAIEIMEKLAKIFDKTHTHILGTDAAYPNCFTLFFTTYLVPDNTQIDQERLRQALQIIGLKDEVFEAFLPIHNFLSATRPKTLFFSWGINAGKTTLQAKIDYEDVRLGVVSEMMSMVSAPEQADILIQWGTELGVRKANYAGVVVDSTGLKAARAYFASRLPISKGVI